MNRCFAVLLSILVVFFSLSCPFSVRASEFEPIEPTPMFYGYEIQGFDIEGNVILSNDDYESYFNERLADRVRAISTYGLSAGVDLESTFFISLGDWLKLSSSSSLSMVADIGLGTPSATINTNLGSIAKKQIYYSVAGAYETITLNVFASSAPNCSYTLTRSGFGASTTWTASGGTLDTLSWGAGGYTMYIRNLSGTVDGGNVAKWAGFNIRAQSVNTLPTTVTDSVGLLGYADVAIIGNSTFRNIPEYAENTFYTNDYGFRGNHTLQTSGNNYFQTFSFFSPISSSTVINGDNINDFSLYGFYIDSLGNVQLDADVLGAYIDDIVLPALELQYQKFYNNFPLPGETAGDPDIQYTDPFEEPTEADTNPPATSPGGSGSGSFDFDYGEVVSPSELWDILESETYYLEELNTEMPTLILELPDDTLPPAQIELLTDALIISYDFWDSLGLSSVLISLGVLAVLLKFIRGN